jgi:hypothetical protein
VTLFVQQDDLLINSDFNGRRACAFASQDRPESAASETPDSDPALHQPPKTIDNRVEML